MAMQDLPDKGMQAILIRHVEKFVFGLVCIISLLLLWMGSKNKPLDSNTHTPTILIATVGAAKGNVEKHTWAAASRDADLPENMLKLDVIGSITVPPGPYSLAMPWHMPPFPPSAKRGDPDLFPVVDLRTASGFGPLALLKREDLAGTDQQPGGGLLGGGGGGGGLLGSDDEDEDQPRQIDPTVQQRLPGYRAQGNELVNGVYYVAITGLIPNRLQFEMYEDTFSLTGEFMPSRDKPKWIFYLLQRVEVTDDPQAEVPEDAWRTVATMHTVREEAGLEGTKDPYWAGRLREVADERYIHENVMAGESDYKLTGPIPPIMLRDLQSAAMHPEIPAYDPHREDYVDKPPAAAAGGAQNLDAFGMPIEDERPGPSDPHGAAGGGLAHGQDEDDQRFDQAQYEYKLFRVFDLDVRPGLIYRYRVQLLLEDPNNPKIRELAPPVSTLEDSVAQRIEEVRRENPRQFYRTTDWSEPTAPTAVPLGLGVMAGLVQSPSQQTLNGQSYRTPYREQVADVLVMVWDESKALDMVGEKQVVRGQRLDFVDTVDVLDPRTREFRRVENYHFSLDKVVIDMVGGEKLPGVDRHDTLETAGQILLFDEFGNLEFHDTLFEMNQYRAIQYLPEDFLKEEDTDEEGGGLLHGQPDRWEGLLPGRDR